MAAVTVSVFKELNHYLNDSLHSQVLFDNMKVTGLYRMLGLILRLRTSLSILISTYTEFLVNSLMPAICTGKGRQ